MSVLIIAPRRISAGPDIPRLSAPTIAYWFTCAQVRALALRFAGADHVSDCELSVDERRLLAEFTTVRVGHGGQLCWPIREVRGDDVQVLQHGLRPSAWRAER